MTLSPTTIEGDEVACAVDYINRPTVLTSPVLSENCPLLSRLSPFPPSPPYPSYSNPTRRETRETGETRGTRETREVSYDTMKQSVMNTSLRKRRGKQIYLSCLNFHEYTNCLLVSPYPRRNGDDKRGRGPPHTRPIEGSKHLETTFNIAVTGEELSKKTSSTNDVLTLISFLKKLKSN